MNHDTKATQPEPNEEGRDGVVASPPGAADVRGPEACSPSPSPSTVDVGIRTTPGAGGGRQSSSVRSRAENVLKLSAPETKDYWEIPILHEDEHLLAIDKPAGLLTSPDRYDPARPNLMRLLHAHIARGVPWAKDRGLSYLANVHRLDIGTSGVLLLAKSKPVLVRLASLFGSEKPLKTYVALVHDAPDDDEFTVDAPLAAHPARPGLMRVDHKLGKRSITEFRVLRRFVGYSWIECRPITGRTHQIRAHLRWVRMPIIGDRTYGGGILRLSSLKRNFRQRDDRPERPLLERVALHARSLEFDHPVTRQPLRIECPEPKDLRVALKYLERYALPTGEMPPTDFQAGTGADLQDGDDGD